jgi:SAM-dependent methyltransferase
MPSAESWWMAGRPSIDRREAHETVTPARPGAEGFRADQPAEEPMPADEHDPFYAREGLGTEIYDAWAERLIAGSPVEGDVEFYADLARRSGGPVLDVGCGTGRIAVALAEAGVEVVGLDLSAPMLRIAERKRAGLPADVARRLTFVRADMTHFTLEQTFPLIVTPSRSFQFMRTSAAQRSALASMRRHLRPDGALVLDLFDPRLEWCVPGSAANEPRRSGIIRNPVSGLDVRVEVIERMPDPMRQLIDEVWRYTELDESGGEGRTATERLVLRWTLRSEVRHLAELEGFAIEAEYGDFRGGLPAYGREQVWILRPA